LYTIGNLDKAEMDLEVGRRIAFVGDCMLPTTTILIIPGIMTIAFGARSDKQRAVIAGATLASLGATVYVAGIPLLAIGISCMRKADYKVVQIKNDLQVN
jgi:hypothetical protein